MKKIKVLVPTATPWDVPNFYRTIGPLMAEPDRYEVRYTTRELTWIDLSWADIVCVPRAYQQQDLKNLEMAEAAGVKTWVDYDDNLLDPPESHPAYLEFMQPDVREGIIQAVTVADLVTASTNELSQVLGKIPREKNQIVVIRNALHPRWPEHTKIHNNSSKFLWRGSNTHLADVLQYAQAIGEGMPENASMQLMGWFAWPLANTILRKTEELAFTKELPINVYFRELKDSCATCVVVPLENNSFNRCKSNIAWLEATAVGALSIVPDFEEWDVPGVIKYTDAESLKLAVANFMDIPYMTRQERWENALAGAIAQSMEAYETRWELLSQLVQSSPSPGSPPPTPKQPPVAQLTLVEPHVNRVHEPASNLN